MVIRRTPSDEESSLAIRAAWLHYVGGLTQAKVAQRLGLPSAKAHRLIARAVADGAVKVTIDGDIHECAALEHQLCDLFGLDFCEIAPDLGEPGLPLRAIGMAGAQFLMREIERGEHPVIGLSHGRTLISAVDQMPRMDGSAVRFVSLLGGLTRHYAANPHDVMYRLAEKTQAPTHIMPVPFFANSAQDRAVLLAQRGVRELLELANNASLKLVGVGSVEADAQLVASGMMEPEEIADIKAEGAVGETLGHFFDARGRILQTALTARTLAANFDSHTHSQIVAIGGGPAKVAPLHAVLLSARLSGLITDELTARALLTAGQDQLPSGWTSSTVGNAP